jgi:hypothetical protein
MSERPAVHRAVPRPRADHVGSILRVTCLPGIRRVVATATVARGSL